MTAMVVRSWSGQANDLPLCQGQPIKAVHRHLMRRTEPRGRDFETGNLVGAGLYHFLG